MRIKSIRKGGGRSRTCAGRQLYTLSRIVNKGGKLSSGYQCFVWNSSNNRPEPSSPPAYHVTALSYRGFISLRDIDYMIAYKIKKIKGLNSLSLWFLFPSAFSTVICLLLACRPSAIRWFVISIIIYSIYRQIISVSVFYRPIIK